MQNTSIQISNVITWIISIAALGIASYSLYLQRRDRKPRLNVTVDLEFGGTGRGIVTGILLHAANPTDKAISLVNIEFSAPSYASFEVPLNASVGSVPPHERRDAIVVMDKFREVAGRMTTGRFVFTDALGHHYYSRVIEF